MAGGGQGAQFRPDPFIVAERQRGHGVTAHGSVIAGILQQVPVNKGWHYELEAVANLPAGTPALAALGLDPTGGTDPRSEDIVWSLRPGADDWISLAERIEAGAETITVFLGLRSLGAAPSAIRWDRAELRQLQPLCPGEGPACTPVRAAMDRLKQERLTAPELLEGLTVAPLDEPLPIQAGAHGRGVLLAAPPQAIAPIIWLFIVA